MDESKDELMHLFSYSNEEQSVFPYLANYMSRIKPHMDEIVRDPEMLERFMLAGLFLTYRAYNHMGLVMSTEEFDVIEESIHTARLRAYRRATGNVILNDRDYLERIRYDRYWKFFLPARLQSRLLFRYVVRG